jgi:hypothetical protein
VRSSPFCSIGTRRRTRAVRDFTDIPLTEVRALIESLQPGCLLILNDSLPGLSSNAYSDVATSQGPVEGEPPPGIASAPVWFNTPLQSSNYWFAHLDNPLEAIAAGAAARRASL